MEQRSRSLTTEEEAREDAQLQRQIEEAKKTRQKGKGKKPRRETIRIIAGIERELHERQLLEEERSLLSVLAGSRSRSAKMLRRRLTYVPGHFVEHVYHLEKYACGKCRGGVTTAKGPTPVLERSSADASLLAHVDRLSKHVDHVPLHRLHRIYARSGARIAVSTMLGLGYVGWRSLSSRSWSSWRNAS